MKRHKDEETEKFERLNCTSANPSDRSTGRQERQKDSLSSCFRKQQQL